MARIAFFGTPDFATRSLIALNDFCLKNKHELSVVITKPDQKQGRHLHVHMSDVKRQALALNLTILEPETLKKNTPSGDEFFATFAELDIDLAIVVAYGKLIPKRILRIPKKGFVNIHASILPKYRGAAPIQRAIMDGEIKTGLCLMDMIEKLDEGDVFAKIETPIIPIDNAQSLSMRLAHLGAYLLRKNLDSLLTGEISKKPQSVNNVSYAHMIEKDEGLLDFSLEGRVLQNKIRGLSPHPGVFAFLGKKRLKLYDSFFVPFRHKEENFGSVISLNPFLGIKCKNGALYFSSIQLEGKKVMSIKEAVLGHLIDFSDTLRPQNQEQLDF